MIRTERLLLRRWQDADREPFAALNADAAVVEHLQVSSAVPQNVRSQRVMERIELVRDPSGDFDHPRVDPAAFPHLVRHVIYRLPRDVWVADFPD